MAQGLLAPMSEQDYIDQLIAGQQALADATVFPDIEGRRPIAGLGMLLPVDMADEGGDFEPAVPQVVKDFVNYMSRTGAGVRGDAPAMAPEEQLMGMMDFTGGGLLASAPARMAAQEAGDAMLGSAGGLTPARKQRILREVDDTLSFNPDAVGYYTKLKNRDSMVDLPVYREDLGILEPKKEIELQDLLGQYLLPAYGDRSATGQNVLGYGNIMFDEPSRQFGGMDFARNVGNSIWSTDRHKERYYRKARQAEEEGTKANLAYTTMAGDSGDFNTMTADIWVNSLDRSKVSKKDAKEFDEKVRKVPAFKDWVGVHAEPEEMKKYLFGLSGQAKTRLAKDFLAKGFAEKIGLPKFDEVRRAQTADELLMVPTYRSGSMIGRVTPDVETVGVPAHPTYSPSGEVAGDYVGGLLTPIPDIIAFRDVADEFMDDAGNFIKVGKDGNPLTRSNLKYTIDAQAPMQMVDEQMLEEADFYVRSLLGR